MNVLKIQQTNPYNKSYLKRTNGSNFANPINSIQNDIFSTQTKSKMSELPHKAILANSATSFNGLGNLLPKTTTGQDLSEIVNCIYCDKPMIPSKKIFSIVWPSSQEPINLYNKKIIEILEPFKEKMHEGERVVFDTIKDLNLQYPQKTFQELLSMVRTPNLEKLNAKENKVLNNLKWTTKDLPKKFSKPIKELIEDGQSRIALDKEFHPFKRKIFIERFGNILQELPDKEKAQSLIDKAYYLPTSKDNESAFIVKYASKVRKDDGTWAYRTTEEIAHNLLCGARSTVDHFEAQHPQDPLMAKGETAADNLAYACDRCNSFLKENTELPRFVKRYPITRINIQKHVNSLILATNNGIIIDGIPYIKGIAKKMEKLSTKDVDLRVDISKLNPAPSYN